MKKTNSNANGQPEVESTEGEIGGKGKSNRASASERAYEPAYEKSQRRASAERENAFNTLAWLIEGATGLAEELRHSDLGLSEDFWVHAYAARKEGLLAIRAVLDELIERGESQLQKEQDNQKRRERRGGVNIDF